MRLTHKSLRSIVKTLIISPNIFNQCSLHPGWLAHRTLSMFARYSSEQPRNRWLWHRERTLSCYGARQCASCRIFRGRCTIGSGKFYLCVLRRKTKIITPPVQKVSWLSCIPSPAFLAYKCSTKGFEFSKKSRSWSLQSWWLSLPYILFEVPVKTRCT